ncbi:zinc carboxypeptidase A 1-like [Spodoptera litura]|uniref:Zinc carboxypeptidase A 1 n=1 Tax=Spodoptera litura TaxID=69820 RepID=A0A9J7IKC6_SPOLT|nr:zinc carboxypeptidase A 1-like [Spodoptera litura]
MYLKLILFSVLLVIVGAEKVRYDNYGLYKVHPENEEHLKFLKDLYTNDEGYDFWTPPRLVGEFVNIVSPPELKEELEHSLKKRSIRAELKVENIQEAFDAQIISRKKRNANDGLYWTNYQTMEDIYAWFDRLEARYAFVKKITIGQSYEGRDITGIKISRNDSSRAIFLHAGEVGADWLSPTVLAHIADQLIHSDDRETRAAAEEFTWYIFPVANPDGFQFSQDSVRGWIKNRRPTNATTTGIDLSKNWNAQWGVSGGSFDARDDNYIGLGPFSEPETRFLSNFIQAIGTSLTGFFSFRAYGQKLLLPFAHSSDPMYNYNEMIIIARRAMGSLAVRYDTQYRVGTSKNIHDGATGSIVDWVKHRFNPTLAATYLLRDTGYWGYTLPPNQIVPTAEETLDSLLAIIREAKFINVLPSS